MYKILEKNMQIVQNIDEKQPPDEISEIRVNTGCETKPVNVDHIKCTNYLG